MQVSFLEASEEATEGLQSYIEEVSVHPERRPLGLRLQICNYLRTLSVLACGLRVPPIGGLSADLMIVDSTRQLGH